MGREAEGEGEDAQLRGSWATMGTTHECRRGTPSPPRSHSTWRRTSVRSTLSSSEVSFFFRLTLGDLVRGLAQRCSLQRELERERQTTHGENTFSTAILTLSETAFHPTFITHQLNVKYAISVSESMSIPPAMSPGLRFSANQASSPANSRSSSRTERMYECRPRRLSWIRVWSVRRTSA